MRINEKTRYPHPVLSVDTHDFNESRFEIEFQVDEDPVQNKLLLLCHITLIQDEIKKLVENNEATLGVDVRCADTYYNNIHSIELSDTIIEFTPGTLCGRVSLRPLIWTCTNIVGFSSPALHEEYGNSKFDLDNGTLLAWDLEQVVQVGRKKLAPMDSIFELARNDDLSDGQINVGLDRPKIQIFASKKTSEHIHSMRMLGKHQAVLLNGVYLPAVLQVLEYIRDKNDFGEQPWYQIFKAKCDFYNLDLQSLDILANAQKLLQMPYLKIEENFRE